MICITSCREESESKNGCRIIFEETGGSQIIYSGDCHDLCRGLVEPDENGHYEITFSELFVL